MKFNFIRQDKPKTMGIRLTTEDYEKIWQLSRRHRITMGTIASEIVSVGLKEIKEDK